jgi:hypothetical protein
LFAYREHCAVIRTRAATETKITFVARSAADSRGQPKNVHKGRPLGSAGSISAATGWFTEAMRVRPVTPELLVSELADRIERRAAPWTRVAIDGAPPAGTADLADALVDPLRLRGRATVRVRTADYLRPASLRLEHGRHDPDAYYSGWFDFDGLNREVLRPLSPAGSGHVLPALWDAVADRSPRLDPVPLPAGGIAIIDGPLLLSADLPFDFTVHLWMPPEALARKTPESQQWMLPAFQRYSDEVQPQRRADYLVRVDRPGHPAVVDSI